MYVMYVCVAECGVWGVGCECEWCDVCMHVCSVWGDVVVCMVCVCVCVCV